MSIITTRGTDNHTFFDGSFRNVKLNFSSLLLSTCDSICLSFPLPETSPPEAEFIVPYLGDIVNSGKGFSYRPTSLYSRAGRYDSIFIPQVRDCEYCYWSRHDSLYHRPSRLCCGYFWISFLVKMQRITHLWYYNYCTATRKQLYIENFPMVVERVSVIPGVP